MGGSPSRVRGGAPLASDGQAPVSEEAKRQGELTDGAGRTVGEVLAVAASVQAPARSVAQSESTPATAEDPLKIEVPGDYVAEEGAPLAGGWRCGKTLGRGQQGCVFLLTDECGAPVGRVLKQLNIGAALAEVSGLVTGAEREWVIGQQLNALARPDGFLPGFMQTGAAVVDTSGRFRGLVLEQLNGREVTQRFEDPGFCDIRYVDELLRQTLVALNRAELAIGFKHRDMRLENVMEHRTGAAEPPPPPGTPPPGFGPRVPLEGMHFKIIDYGHAVVARDEARDAHARQRTRLLHRLLPGLPLLALPERVYRWVFRDRGDVWRLARSTGTLCDGRTWPAQDRADVERVMRFIGSTTGIRPRAYFAAAPRAKGPLQRALAFGGSLFFVRWARTMLQAYIFPGRPGLRAGQALKMMGHAP